MTISAKEAISLGAKILNEHLNLFVDLSDEAKKAEIMIEREETKKEKVLEMHNRHIFDIPQVREMMRRGFLYAAR